MNEPIPTLLAELLGAESFEAVAETVLRAMLARTERALRASAFAAKGRLLRGMVHLRPEGGYRGLVVLEHGQKRPSAPQEDAMLPSVTVWRLVESRERRVAVDVMLAEATPLGGAPEVLKGLLDKDADDAFASQGRLLSREATHLLCLPLRLSTAQVVGMISMEANCPTAMGQPFIWGDCGEDLQLLADLATPYLLSRPLRPAPRSPWTGDALLPVVGPSMEGLVNLLRAFAPHDETILLTGLTGTGKTRLARWCHAHSRRREGPFEIADLNTVPREMQMAELFGWKRGAFTGAISDHSGWVAQAEGGTLFLDEIDKLSQEAQAGLLHLLEERRYRVLGDTAPTRAADVRFLIGTNVDLRAAVKEGRFREDLYYRINVLPVHLPTLRERRDEILPWAEFMVERRHRESGLAAPAHLSSDVGLVLSTFPWPGNLRQLDNVIRRAYTMTLAELAGGSGPVEIGRRHIAQALGFEREREGASLPEVLRQAARAYALEAERRKARGEALPLDLAESFAGLVLSAGVTLTGSRKDAFLLFGLESAVENRNHNRLFKLALGKVLAALEAMGQEPEAELEGQLKE